MGLNDIQFVLSLAAQHPLKAFLMFVCVLFSTYAIAYIKEKAKQHAIASPDPQLGWKETLAAASTWLLQNWYYSLPLLLTFTVILWSLLQPPECDPFTMSQEEYDKWKCYEREYSS